MLTGRRYFAAVAAVSGALASHVAEPLERSSPALTSVRINGVRFDIVSLSIAGQRDAMALALARAWRAEGTARPHVLQLGNSLVVGRQRGSLHETVSISPGAASRLLEVRVAVQDLSLLPGRMASLPFAAPSGLRLRNVVEHASGEVTFTLDDVRGFEVAGPLVLQAAGREGWRMSQRAVRGGAAEGGLAFWGSRGGDRIDGVAVGRGTGTRILLLVWRGMADGATHAR
jgi:hypothetical protein